MTARNRALLAIGGVLVVIVAGWLLAVQPKRDQAAKLQTEIGAAQTQLSAARAELASYEAARRAFTSSYATLVRLGEAVPTDDNTPSLIYQLQGAANAAHVQFDGLTFNAGSGGSSPTGSTAGGSSAGGSSATLPPGATIGPAGFPIEPFTFTFQGSFFNLANFFGRLQRFVVATNKQVSVSGRLMTLNAITLGAGPAGFPQVQATISATTYLLPASEGLLNGATPAGPAAAGTQTVSTAKPTTSAAPAVIAAPVR